MDAGRDGATLNVTKERSGKESGRGLVVHVHRVGEEGGLVQQNGRTGRRGGGDVVAVGS